MKGLFLTVLRMGISASYLILAVVAARFLLKKAPKGIICMLWAVVGLRLLCPFPVETAFSLLPEQTGPFASQMDSTELAVQGEAVPEAPLLPDTGLPQAGTGKVEGKQAGGASRGETAAAWIWMAGAACMAAYMLWSWYRLRRQVSEAVPSWAGGIRFYQCAAVSSPFLFGLAAPKIYVPFSVSGQELFYILKHEQAHKKRYDHLSKVAGYLILSIYWFQPLVWAAYLLFCRDIELACDESVVKEIGEGCKKAYSQALLSNSLKHNAGVVYPVAFGEVGVKNRVKHILKYKKPGCLAIFAAAAVCVAVALCFATEAKSKRTVQAQPDITGYTKNLDAVKACVEKWAKAFCGRDAKAIYGMLDGTGRKQLSDAGMLDGEHSFGWSSPWPWDVDVLDGQQNYRILSVDEESAEILYYAWTSDPHVTVWHQSIAYEYAGGADGMAVYSTQLEILDSIHTAGQFFTAYPDGAIDGTRMDYYHGNGAGEALNRNALQNGYWDVLSQPETAAVFLLNIQDDPSVVKVARTGQDGETAVTFTFLEDGSTASVKMVQLAGKKSIWVPQTKK